MKSHIETSTFPYLKMHIILKNFDISVPSCCDRSIKAQVWTYCKADVVNIFSCRCTDATRKVEETGDWTIRKMKKEKLNVCCMRSENTLVRMWPTHRNNTRIFIILWTLISYPECATLTVKKTEIQIRLFEFIINSENNGCNKLRNAWIMQKFVYRNRFVIVLKKS